MIVYNICQYPVTAGMFLLIVTYYILRDIWSTECQILAKGYMQFRL